MALNNKLKLFADHLLICNNEKEAALKAGYSKSTAEKKAHAWVGKSRSESKYPELFDYYEEKRKQLVEKLNLEANDVLRELMNIAFANITDVVNVEEVELQVEVPAQKKGRGRPKNIKRKVKTVLVNPTANLPKATKAAISEIKQTESGISIKFHDKVAALDKLGKYLKLWTEKHEVDTGPNFLEFMKQAASTTKK